MLIRSTLAALALAATPALADIERKAADGEVMEVFKNLEVAVAEAGATIFARVDHAQGARDAGMQLNEAKLLIFGNPNLGTKAMQDDIRAGLFLPLKMLVYRDDDGQTWIAWEEVEEMFDDLDIDDDAEYVETMEKVLENFAEDAAE